MTSPESLRTLADYGRALTEIEQYFKNVLEPGTEGADRFKPRQIGPRHYFGMVARSVGSGPHSTRVH